MESSWIQRENITGSQAGSKANTAREEPDSSVPRRRAYLPKQSDVCSARILLNEPREGYAASPSLLYLHKRSRRELERCNGQLLLREARSEHLAGHGNDLPFFHVSRNLTQIQNDPRSVRLAQEARYRYPERCLILSTCLHEVAYGFEQFRVCRPTLFHFLGFLEGATRYEDGYQ